MIYFSSTYINLELLILNIKFHNEFSDYLTFIHINLIVLHFQYFIEHFILYKILYIFYESVTGFTNSIIIITILNR